MKSIIGLIMYGIPNPYAQSSPAPVIYTNGALPTTGRPSELSFATVIPDLGKLPGINWGADPRHPAGEESEALVTIKDDKLGTLGTIFLDDPSAPFWGLEVNRLSSAALSVNVVGCNPTPPTNDVPYFLGNECMTTSTNSLTAHGTAQLSLTRAQCGSFAKVHVLRPTDYSPGEDGTQDRMFLRSKPNWDDGFFCGLYCFLLNERGDIARYILRRGIVLGEPTPTADLEYQIKIKFLEGAINSHQVGETSKEITLELYTLITALDGPRPKEVSILLKLKQAEAFFNEPLSPRGGSIISAAMVANLSARMKADPQIEYQVKLANDNEWVYKITNLSVYYWNSSGVAYQAVKIVCSLVNGGYSEGATILDANVRFKPWFQNNITGSNTLQTQIKNGFYGEDYPAPTISLRAVIRKSVVKAFLTLCISNDGSSGDTYDKLIGGLGASMPESFFSIGSPTGSPLSVLGNTRLMLELDELLNPQNVYYFELTKGVSLKDFLTNEFLGSQLLLGSFQTGDVGLKSWNHEVAATVSLQPLNQPVKPGQRLDPIKRLDLTSGTRVLTLEPEHKLSVRYQGSTTIKPAEALAIRFWREGLQLTPTDITSGDLTQLVRAFYKVFGGAPKIYEVPIAIEDYAADSIEFGDAVAWSDASTPTPTGRGISGEFYVVGVDLNFDEGIANLKLLKNTLAIAPTPTQTGNIAPSLSVVSVTGISATEVDIEVVPLDGSVFNPSVDYGGVFDSSLTNGSPIKIDSYNHAPIGSKEAQGSMESFGTITNIAVGASVVFRVEFDPEYMRGTAVAPEDLFTPNESRVNLPHRQNEDVALDSKLKEADVQAGPGQANFVSFQPVKPTNGATHTFRS